MSIRCGNKMGSGFFVDEEVALTNAHVACPLGKSMTVVLPDGRQLLGETLKRDDDLDLATVRVVGAKAVPLKLGDVTRLQPGDPLVFIGSPKGLDFTVHEGKVAFVGRQYLGLGYVQFNASVNPGNSGGPLLDGRGEVVGVVSMKIENADGLGLALPIAYAGDFVSVPSTPEAKTRWEELLSRVARDEEREVEHFKAENSQPVLASLKEVDGLGIVALLIEHFDALPSRARHRLILQAGSETCSMYVDFEYWKPIKEVMNDEHDSRRMRWIASHGITEGVHVGAARLPVEDCTLPTAGKAFLKLDGAGDEELIGTRCLSRSSRRLERRGISTREASRPGSSCSGSGAWRSSARGRMPRSGAPPSAAPGSGSPEPRRRSTDWSRMRPRGRTCASSSPTRRRS